MELTSRLKNILKITWPAIFLAVVAFGTFFTTLVIKDRTFYMGQDNIDQFYAWYQKLAHAVHSGALPIWDPNTSAGHSFVGELQEGVFYPINLIWVWLFGSIKGISIFWLELIVVFHFWIAALGMYLAARSVGLKKASSLIAAMAFAFGGEVAVRSVSQTAIFFGLCYSPWVFYWFQRYISTNKKINLLWAGVALGFIILAGHIDPWYFSCVLIALSIVFRAIHPNFESWPRVTLRRLAALLIAIVISLIVAIPQVALSAQYLPKAVRFAGDPAPTYYGRKISNHTFTMEYNFDPQNILSLLDPVQYQVADGNPIYIGLTGLVVIVVTCVGFRRKLKNHIVWRSQKLFLLGSSGVIIIIMLGYWTFIPSVLRFVPDFTEVRQLARYDIIIQFCLAIMLGICVEVLSDNLIKVFSTKKRKLLGMIGALMLFVFLFLNTTYYYLISKRTGNIDKHFVYQNAILTLSVGLVIVLRKHIKYILLGAMVLSSITAPVWFMPKISDYEADYPPNYYKLTPAIKFLENYYGKDRILINNNSLPVNIGDVYDIQTVGGYGATLQTNFYQYLQESDPTSQPGLHLDLLNVRFIVDNKPEPGLKRVFYDKVRHISIYERQDYLPRAYFANQLTACNEHLLGCTNIDITKYSASIIDLKYSSPKPQQLVLSEVYFPGWQASVDGKTVEIEAFSPTPTKLFRSIEVPAGTHTVEFKYRPLGL